MQGDDCDSSDEEWEQHIGRHARAFLGLNEPVAEIALDEGVGMGTMVRNAFARADDIHLRASLAECSSTGIPDGSHVDEQQFQGRNSVGLDNANVDHNDAGSNASEGCHMLGYACDMDMHSNNTANLGANSRELGDSTSGESSAYGGGNRFGGTNEQEPSLGGAENGHAVDDASDSVTGEEWDATDDISTDGEDVEEMLEEIPREHMGSNPEIDTAATLPLYEGSTVSMLCATLLILNCCKTHGVSNMFIHELLMLLSMSILPAGNCLPKTEYEASKILRRLGLAYNMIHACPNGCCLFKGDLENEEKCPVCEHERYRMSGRARVPTLILRHFPLIPQLQRMFSSKKLSKLNVWHHFHKSEDGKMRHTADSPQWNFVHTELEPDAGNGMFGQDPRDMHLGLALDGMNPYSEKRSTQSLTPVIVFNYNLPPWMVTKKYFVMLCLLIPTKLSLTGLNVDVFLQPLVDELQQLWSREGVLTRDARAYLGMSVFKLRAVLMWTLHDFPAYGLISGLTTKGFKACPVCGPHTISRRSKVLRKNVYCNCHRRYLPYDHYFRGAVAAFDNEANVNTEEEPLTGNQTIRRGYQSEAYLDGGGMEKDDGFPAKEHGVKRVSALYQLPYWRVSALTPRLLILLVCACIETTLILMDGFTLLFGHTDQEDNRFSGCYPNSQAQVLKRNEFNLVNEIAAASLLSMRSRLQVCNGVWYMQMNAYSQFFGQCWLVLISVGPFQLLPYPQSVGLGVAFHQQYYHDCDCGIVFFF